MLVISQKEGGTVRIGENIVLHIVTARDGKVRLALDAPKSVKIVRGELIERDRRQAERYVGRVGCDKRRHSKRN